MTRAHGATAAGVPVDLIGQPLMPGAGSVPGVIVRSNEQMANAPTHGVYVDAKGHRFRIKAGDPLPKGAVMEGDEPADEPKATKAPAKRSKGSAPENRAKADEAETR